MKLDGILVKSYLIIDREGKHYKPTQEIENIIKDNIAKSKQDIIEWAKGCVYKDTGMGGVNTPWGVGWKEGEDKCREETLKNIEREAL